MNFDSLLFPVPETDINIVTWYKQDTIYIPKYDKSNYKITRHIPALYLEPHCFQNIKKIIIYFHGNSEDIFSCRELMSSLRDHLYIVSLIAIEYPGYSVYKTNQSINSDQMLDDALTVFDYLKDNLGISEEKIFVFGRSLGSAPAVYLSANRKPNGLILMSPFTSIRDIAQDLVGNFFKYLISNRFDNLKLMKKISCDLLIIHGQKDTLISYKHSISLKNECSCPYEVILPEEMTHNSFDLKKDLLKPLYLFLKKNTTSFYNEEDDTIKMPDSLYTAPSYIKKEVDQRIRDSEIFDI